MVEGVVVVCCDEYGLVVDLLGGVGLVVGGVVVVDGDFEWLVGCVGVVLVE